MCTELMILNIISNFLIYLNLLGGNSGEEMLVLIDQHAAHERIRLEDLTKGMVK